MLLKGNVTRKSGFFDNATTNLCQICRIKANFTNETFNGIVLADSSSKRRDSLIFENVLTRRDVVEKGQRSGERTPSM